MVETELSATETLLFETEIRSERQLDGIHQAKELGARFGRKQLLSASQIAELHIRRAQVTLSIIN